ncbi:hypothetical protein G5B40_02720 [Pikeienuella piscinae]|uniref:Hydantoinase/oxoprolinase N-terminal domain-containing protein n=1 Tax=Pikeienuella piscinae TaxID=2748098 RepID=A0A7L5BU39_9RHOB|nr:hydantoinase/oxoprolinase N-terminal domain-containing protein [Pikeienuella piscinae]QIE54443.1 hypothetical protein G5B40_02720 [Pikeienuella piscinae]
MEPIIARGDCFEVEERVHADERVHAAPDLGLVRETLAPKLRRGGYASVAIGLLDAYVNPAHERALARLLTSEVREIFVAFSSGIFSEFREYERASTTALSAYVQPVVER